MYRSTQEKNLEDSLALLSWLQVRLLNLGNHPKAEIVARSISSIEKILDSADRLELSYRGEHIARLLNLLKELTQNQDIATTEQIEHLGNIVNEITKGPFYKIRVLIPEAELKKRVEELADIVRMELDPARALVLGVLKGSIFFMVDLLRALKLPLRFDFLDAKSYGDSMDSSKNVKLGRVEQLDVKGKTVLLVEDIVDTGHTINSILRFLKGQEPEKLITCVLIDKLHRREVDVEIDYYGFRVEEGFLVGYGLDFADRYRCLRDICVLESI